MQIVIIAQNQREFLTPMLNAVKGHEVVYVFDRCSDSSEQYPLPANVRAVVSHEGDGFLAGRMRDKGAQLHDPSKPILFLDGDRIPTGDLLELTRTPYDVVCLGTNNDTRAWINSGEGPIPWVDFMNPNNDVYSCGIYLKPAAIAAAKKASAKGRIFHEIFDGHWGEEDRYLGDVVHQAGLTLGYTSKVKLAGKINGLTPSNSGSFSINWITRLKLSGRLGPEMQKNAGNRQDAMTQQLLRMGEEGWLLTPEVRPGQPAPPSPQSLRQG